MIRQPPAGVHRGGLWGQRSDPGLGIVPAAGPHLVEDWMRYGQANDYGECGWDLQGISGGGTVTPAASGASDVVGVVSLRSGAQSGRGGVLHLTLMGSIYQPPIGMVWATKADLSAKTSVEAWSGYSNSNNGRVATGDSTEFIGIRYIAAGAAEWEGVCKTGAGANNETAVALGDHTVGTYSAYGWEAVDTDGAGTLGIQFFSIDGSSRNQLYRTLIGDPVTSNIPTTVGAIGMGVVTTASAQRIVYQDYWVQGGRTAR